jgi:hypothetical protein
MIETALIGSGQGAACWASGRDLRDAVAPQTDAFVCVLQHARIRTVPAPAPARGPAPAD